MSESNWQSSGLQTELYRRLIAERDPGTPEIKEIAARFEGTQFARDYGYSWSLVYKYVSGEKCPPPEFFVALFQTSGIRWPLDWFIDQCPGLRLVETNIPAAELNGDLSDELLNADIHKGELVSRYQRAIKDKVITVCERDELLAVVQRNRAEFEKMEEELKRMEVR